ncbi:MAG: DUF1186 domain-containing protein [Betaproteobacteria bacterium]|nr:DUF1186 domain-containing protein [Betaproteobacteria bacterium]
MSAETLPLSEENEALIDELFDAFTNPIDFPFEAVAKAKANWPAVGTAFIQELEDAVADPWAYANGDMIYEFAYRLASDMRDTRAFAPLLATLYFPEDISEALMGDGTTSNLPRALACTFDASDPSSEVKLRGVAENRKLFVWSRVAAVEALCIRALEGDADLDSLKSWIHGLAKIEAEAVRLRDEDTTALESLISTLTDLRGAEYLPDIEVWRTTLPLVLFCDSLEHIRESITSPISSGDYDAKFHRYYGQLTEEFATWATFTESDERDARAALGDEEFDGFPEEGQLPFVRPTPKVGRNDPCPCGSGQKFKKCCGKDT